MIVCDQSVSKSLYLRQQKEEEEKEEEEEEKEEDEKEEEEEEDGEEEEEKEEKMEEEEEKEEEEKMEEEEEEKEKKPGVIGDAAEGKTLFVRNIPMDATQKDLFRFFKRYGRLVYVKLCQDKYARHEGATHRLTTLSKGTGFVKFEEQKDADALLAKYEKIARAFQNVSNGRRSDGKETKKEMSVEDEEGGEDGED